MYFENADWQDLVRSRAAFIELGQQSYIHLGSGCVYPWEHVTEVNSGNVFRGGLDIAVSFRALIDGLSFDWTLYLDTKEDKSLIDVSVLREVLPKLKVHMRQKLLELVGGIAGKLLEQATELRKMYERRRADAEELYVLSGREAP